MRRHRSDRAIGLITLFLMGLGLIVIYAIGPMRVNFMNNSYGTDYPENYFFIHQLVSVLLAVGVLTLAFKVPYPLIRKTAKWTMITGLILCALLAILAAVGSELTNCQLGACRWFNLGILGSFQPAELLKLGLVLYLAQLVAKCKKADKLGSFREFWLPLLVMCGLALFFVVVVQSDLGTGVAMLAIILMILLMSGMPLRYFAVVMGVVLVGGCLAIVSSPHRMERLATYGGGGENSYHIENAMMAIGTGGFFGVGIGNSVQATGYLPESINDSVFAVMGETFGFVGLLLIIGCFVWLLLRLIRVAQYLPSTEASLVVMGVFAWAGAHVVINIAAMTGLMPLTGITLPLLSYGGTSMVFMAAAIGVCLQLSCYTGREESKHESISSRRGLGGTYHASRRGNSRSTEIEA